MRLIFFIFLFAILLVRNSNADPTLGVAYYSIQNKTFPCERALNAFQGIKKPALMFLWGTFGDDLSCVEKFIKMNNKQKQVYIHFSNECCRRNGTCKKGELLKDYSVKTLNNILELNPGKIKKNYQERMQKILKFIEESQNQNPNQNIDWYISTGLEDNYSFDAKKKVFNFLKNEKNKSNLKDKIKIYVNPLNGLCIKSRCEIHDINANKNHHWVYLPDGYCVKPLDACNNNIFTSELQNAKIKAQLRNGNAYFLWWSEQQGRYGEPPNQAKPPRQRIIKITDKQIMYVNKLLRIGN